MKTLMLRYQCGDERPRHVSRVGGSRRDRGKIDSPLVDRLQLLARLEPNCFARRNRNFSASARITADAGLARSHVEDAKAPQLIAIALLQRPPHALENGFDSELGLGLGNAGLVHDFVDDVELDHGLLPAAD